MAYRLFRSVDTYTPSGDYDLATKAYVDGVAQGLDVKKSVIAASTASFTMASTASATTLVLADDEGGFDADANTFTQDAISLAAGARVLIKDGVNSNSAGVSTKWNGIYTVGALTGSTVTLTRATDADTAGDLTSGSFTFVEKGTANSDTGWVMTQDAAITMGTTTLPWAQFSGAGAVSAGTGMSRTGTALSTTAAQTHVTSVGTLAAGAISSGFGNIDNGSNTLSTGVATLASLVCTAGATFGGGASSGGVSISTAGVMTGDAAWSSTGAITGGTLTDGTFTTTSGAITGVTNLTLSGVLTDGNYIFDTSGNVSGLGTVGCGAITSSGNLAVTGTLTGDTSLTLDSTTLITAELAVLDGVTAGAAAASKALVLDSNKDIGTLRNLTINGTFSDGNYTFDTSGNVSGLGTVGCGAITASGTSTFATACSPDASDGATLGSASAEWSDLFLADAGTVAFGDDQDIVLTHVADVGLKLSTLAANNGPGAKTSAGALAGFTSHVASNSPAAGDYLGGFFMNGEDANSDEMTFAAVQARLKDATNGAAYGALLMHTLIGDSLVQVADFGDTNSKTWTFADGDYNVDVLSHDGTNGLKLGGTLVTTSAAELNLIDSDAYSGLSLTALTGSDGIIVNDESANEMRLCPIGSVIMAGLPVAVTKTSAATLATDGSEGLILCDPSGGAFTITLPSAAATVRSGWNYLIKNHTTSTNAITIATEGSEKIDDQSTLVLDTPRAGVRLYTDGAHWHIF